MKIILWLLKFLPKLRDLFAAENSRLNTELQEKLRAYEQHFAQTAKEVEAYKSLADEKDQANLKLRVQASMQAGLIEDLQNQIGRLRNETTQRLKAVDNLPARSVWDSPVLTEDGSTIAAEG